MGSASLQWSSYLGGNSIDHGYGIAVRGTAVYVVGTSFSVDFPTTDGAYDRTADSDPDTRDGVVAKIEVGLPSPSTAANARYVYDAEGNRVERTTNGVTTIYVGGYFEREGTSTRKSYYFGGQLVAVRQHGVLSYLLSDHLGSTSVTVDSVGVVVSEQRCAPYGRTRTHWGSSTPTNRRFTGQRFKGNGLGGLYDYILFCRTARVPFVGGDAALNP